tara:strand:- start:235 stop:531 length:297 start_codon:yes stop_codon:yes gene_type:complete
MLLAGLAKKILQTIVDFLNAAIFSLIIVRVVVYIMSSSKKRSERREYDASMHPLTSHHLTQKNSNLFEDTKTKSIETQSPIYNIFDFQSDNTSHTSSY